MESYMSGFSNGVLQPIVTPTARTGDVQSACCGVFASKKRFCETQGSCLSKVSCPDNFKECARLQVQPPQTVARSRTRFRCGGL
eukprot:gene13889-22679_t